MSTPTPGNPFQEPSPYSPGVPPQQQPGQGYPAPQQPQQPQQPGPGYGAPQQQQPIPGYPAPQQQPGFGYTPGASILRPKNIDYAFFAWLAATGVGIISIVYSIMIMDYLITKAMIAQGDTGLDLEQLRPMIQVVVVGTLVVSAIMQLVCLLFVFKMRSGRNWARIVLTVLTAISLISIPYQLTQSLPLGSLVLIVVYDLLIIIALVLMWLKDSSAYFTAVKQSRQFV